MYGAMGRLWSTSSAYSSIRRRMSHNNVDTLSHTSCAGQSDAAGVQVADETQPLVASREYASYDVTAGQTRDIFSELHPSLRSSFVALPSDPRVPLTPEQLSAVFGGDNCISCVRDIVRLAEGIRGQYKVVKP